MLKRGEVILDVCQLERMQVVRLGFVHLDELLVVPQRGIGRGPATVKVALNPVHFHDVPPCEFVARRIGWKERRNVHPVVVPLDVLHEHVYPPIVAVDVEFAVPPARGVTVDFVPQFINQGVAHQRLV